MQMSSQQYLYKSIINQENNGEFITKKNARRAREVIKLRQLKQTHETKQNTRSKLKRYQTKYGFETCCNTAPPMYEPNVHSQLDSAASFNTTRTHKFKSQTFRIVHKYSPSKNVHLAFRILYSFEIGLRKVLVAVFTRTCRTRLFRSGKMSTTFPRGHLPLGAFSSCTRTISSML